MPWACGVDGNWLKVVGDCNGQALFTHMGRYQARIAVDVILGLDTTIGTERPHLDEWVDRGW